MNSTSTQYITSRRMDVFDPIHQISMWGDFKGNGYQDASPMMIIEVDAKLDNQSEDTSHGTIGPSNQYDQETSKPVDKVLRRLAQNREAARKSRLRKKAYVQQLETSRMKLIQLEQELDQARQQGAYVGGGLDGSHLGYCGTANSGTAAFEMEYGHWVEKQIRKTIELRTALQSHVTDTELRKLVDDGMNHYFDLFNMKATAAKADVFYLMSGMWKTPTERFFMWIGGFRPSELLKILVPHLDLLKQQLTEVHNLTLSCQQLEEAVTQGMDKLQQTLADAVAAGRLGHLGEGSYFQMNTAIERLEDLVSFVNQADHLRKEALLQMMRILTIRQAASGLVVLGDYLQRLRDLSSVWASRLCEPA